MKSQIDSLIERVEKIAADDKYRALRERPPRVQVMVGLGRSLMGKVLGYNMIDYFHDMEVRLSAQLQSKIFSFENFADDTIIKAEVGYDYGGAGTLPNTMFGVLPVFDSEKDPFCSLEPVISEPSDLRKLTIPNFFETDPMPLIHEKYRELCALVDGRLGVTFPGWSRSPWSVATFLRGFTQLYMDVVERPDFVRELLDFIVECRISWEKQRCDFLNIEAMALDNENTWYSNCYVDYRPVHVSDYYSDEVDGSMLSPEMYAGVVFPAELKLARFYGQVRYYHSCGNLTPLLPTLLELPGIQMLHVSSWTDLSEAYRQADPSIVVQKVVHPQDDVMDADEHRIRTQICDIMSIVPDRRLLICADAIYEGEMSKVQRWLKIAKKVVHEAWKNTGNPAEDTG
jgi:hypothetical protein